MKKNMLFSVLIIVMSLNVYSQLNLAEVNKINGFYIFIDSKPIEEYEAFGEIQCDETDKAIRLSGGQYTSVRDNLIKRARLANYTADGLILSLINGGEDKAIMIKFKNKDAKNNIAKVEQYQGLYVFSDCNPIKENTYIDTVTFSGGFSSPQYSNVRDVLIKRARKKSKDASGIVLKFVSGGYDLGDAIKF